MASTEHRRNRRAITEYSFDYSLLFIILFLIGFGFIMIYSASSYAAFTAYGKETFFLRKQMIAVGIGAILMFALAFIPYEVWAHFVWPFYIITFVLIPLVNTSLGVESHGARRWIKIPGIGFNLQPAEVAKTCLIIVVANIICWVNSFAPKKNQALSTYRSMVYIFTPVLPIAFMVYWITDNLSSAIIIVAIAFVMNFVSSPKYMRYVVMVLGVVAVATAIVLMAINSEKNATGFRMGRVRAWLYPEKYADDKGYQTLQALYAIGSGGVWGKGLGNSMQKLNYIPESQNDMIFAIVCEELGLFGAIAVLMMFVLLIWRLVDIARHTRDLFGAMLVVGVTSHISLQVILNVAVVTNLVPNTGISLPFISYGGSAAIFLMIELGLVFSVARSNVKRSAEELAALEDGEYMQGEYAQEADEEEQKPRRRNRRKR